MTLPSYAFRNPENVAIRNEQEQIRIERECGQCRERVSIHWKGEEIVNCGIKYQRYGRRCEHFYKTEKDS